jgi:hypothetical protein
MYGTELSLVENVFPWNVDGYSHVGVEIKISIAVETGSRFSQPFANKHFQFRRTNQMQNHFLY